MGGGNYRKKNETPLTEEELRRRHRRSDGDAYIFDVEYEKLKKEQEKLDQQYEKAREEYRQISEQLRREMLNGTASEGAMNRFMAALTNKGALLQQQQQELQQDIDRISEERTSVEQDMAELRLKAFGGSTHANVNLNTDYKGFKLDNTSANKYANAKVVEMTPQEYFRRIAFDVRGNGLDDVLNNIPVSSADKFARQMLRGIRFSAPELNYQSRSSKGDARAMAALLNGYGRIPVLVIE